MLKKLFKKEGNLPTFFILGAQKCGTSSLHHYLAQHPEIRMSDTKELFYFVNNFHKGKKWYRQNFKRTSVSEKHFGESTPYYFYHPRVPQMMKKMVPKAKFIVLLRDPKLRAYSNYKMEVRLGHEKEKSFWNAIKMEPHRLQGATEKLMSSNHAICFEHAAYSYVSRSLYGEQIERWFSLFPKENFLFLKSEDFFAKPEIALERIYHFLSLKSVLPEDSMAKNEGEYAPLAEEEIDKLDPYFAEDQKKIVSLIGSEFTW